MKYKSLNDAVKTAKQAYRPVYEPGPIRIWYAKDWDGQFHGADLLKQLGIATPTPDTIWKSHARLGSIDGAVAGTGRTVGPRRWQTVMDVIFAAMQGENWSPKGEANNLIKSLGLRHTSMSVGDIIQPPDGTLWYVDSAGFKKIWPKRNPSLRRGRRPKRKNPSDLRSIMRKYG